LARAKVIDVLRRFLDDYLRTEPPLCNAQRRAIWALIHCRTPAMGGHLYACKKCGDRAYSYHSCNHKACPQCGRQATADWVDRELGKLVGAPYFMVTFTLPSELRGLFFGPLAKEAYDVFFAATSTALRQKLASPNWFGAQQSGFTGVLHTWNQHLLPHFHIHYIVPGAGIDGDGRVVRVKSANFLVALDPLKIAFRHEFRELFEAKGWRADPAVWHKDWGIHIKPFGSGANAVKYLGAYVSRTAIGDHRIVSMDGPKNNEVTFLWKDRNDGDKIKPERVSGVEFVRRYLRHVLPKGLRSIRYYGYCHPTAKNKREGVRFHTGMPLQVGAAAKEEKSPRGVPSCSCCKEPMEWIMSVGRMVELGPQNDRAPPPPISASAATHPNFGKG
jgi:hypothetical protein